VQKYLLFLARAVGIDPFMELPRTRPDLLRGLEATETDLCRAGGHIELRDVVELLAADPAQDRLDILDLSLELAVLQQNSLLGRLKNAVEPAQYDQGQDDGAPLVRFVLASKNLRRETTKSLPYRGSCSYRQMPSGSALAMIEQRRHGM
jgi:hypothetical protein